MNNVTKNDPAKITVLDKCAWHKLVSSIRIFIAGNMRMTNAEIEQSILSVHPDYASQLIASAANTARNFHLGCLEYETAMKTLDYGNEIMEASVLNYLTDALQIKESVAKAAIAESRMKLKQEAFDLMTKVAKNGVDSGDIHAKPTSVAARINDERYDGELNEKLFGMLVVAVASRQNTLCEEQYEKRRENERLLAEKNAADEKIQKEKAAVALAAKKAEDAAKAAKVEQRAIAKAERLAEILARPRVQFRLAGHTFFAFSVNTLEESYLLNDGTFCAKDCEIFKVNKSAGGRTSTSFVAGVSIVVDKPSAKTETTTATPVTLDLDKVPSVWVTTKEQTIKALVIAPEQVKLLEMDAYLIHSDDSNVLYRKTGKNLFPVGTCRPATRDEKTAAKGHKMSKAA